MSRKLTKEDLQEEWRRLFDSSYTEPIETEDEGRGFDIIAGFSAIFANVSLSTETTTQAMYIDSHSIQTNDPASGAVQATGTIAIDREPPKQGDINLKAGDTLDMTHLGTKGETVVIAQIELVNDTTIPEGASAPVNADVRAVRPGYQSNGGPLRSVAFSRRTTAEIENVTSSGNTLTSVKINEGYADAFVRFTSGVNATTYPRRITSATDGSMVVDGPALATGANTIEIVDVNTIGLSATLVGEMSGGKHPWLDLLGLERLIPRNPNELDSSYRYRIQQLPDVVTPNALFRAVSRILKPLTIGFVILETRVQDDFQGFFYDLDPYDDPAASFPDGTYRLTLGDGFDERGFIVLIERQNTGEFGAPYDSDPATSGFTDNAFDQTFFDGFPATFEQNVQDIIKEVERTRTHGMPWVWSVVDTIS